MAKYPYKLLWVQSNRRTSIHRRVKVKRPNKIQQQSSHKREATKVNAIMEKLDESDGNWHCRKNNINHLPHLYESDDDKSAWEKTKTPSMVLGEK